MKRYRLSRDAQRDLVEIGRFTQRECGTAQRRLYLARLRERCESLAGQPGLGVRRDDLLPGYRSFREARHVIYYVERPHGIDVIRFLHERIDVRGHLVRAATPD